MGEDCRSCDSGMRLYLHVDELGTDLCMLAIGRLVLFVVSTVENRGIFVGAATISTAVISDLIIMYFIFAVWAHDAIVERICVKQSLDGRFRIHTDEN
jgi:hypothetical protein